LNLGLQHPVSYPSYQTTTASIRSLAVLQGLPTTIFINTAGKTVFVHTGQYDSPGTLEQDIRTYALRAAATIGLVDEPADGTVV